MLVAFAAFLGLGFLAFTALNIEAYPDPARNGLPRSQAVLSVATNNFHGRQCGQMPAARHLIVIASPWDAREYHANRVGLIVAQNRLRWPAVEPIGQFLNGSHVTRSGSARQFPRHSKNDPVWASLPNSSASIPAQCSG